MAKNQASTTPTGWRKLAFRLPIYLYRWGLGWLMPNRFLYLTHIGRKSGQPRETVLEVAKYDATTDTYSVACGFGRQTQWYQNLQKTPQARIQVGSRKLDVTAHLLSEAESGMMMVEYAQTYPKTAKALMSFIGQETDGSEAAYRRIGEEQIPFVSFRPR